MAKQWTVGEVGRLAHVTVRTLHHYDELGLLPPRERGPNGYRVYGEAELARLQQIMLFRELGFTLEAVGRLLDDPAFDRRAALEAQAHLLDRRIRALERVRRAVDRTREALEGGEDMDEESMFEGLDGFDAGEYEAEVRERWGKTEAYRESMRRTRRYGKSEWRQIREETERQLSLWAELQASGAAADGEAAMNAAEAHRRHIERWFYPCSHGMHRSLGEMYVADPRFRDAYDTRAAGLAAYVAAAIRANAERAAAGEFDG